MVARWCVVSKKRRSWGPDDHTFTLLRISTTAYMRGNNVNNKHMVNDVRYENEQFNVAVNAVYSYHVMSCLLWNWHVWWFIHPARLRAQCSCPHCGPQCVTCWADWAERAPVSRATGELCAVTRWRCHEMKKTQLQRRKSTIYKSAYGNIGGNWTNSLLDWKWPKTHLFIFELSRAGTSRPKTCK